MTTAQLLSDWMTKYQRERIKTQTYERYQGIIDLHINPELGDVDIKLITRHQSTNSLRRRKKKITSGKMAAYPQPVSI